MHGCLHFCSVSFLNCHEKLKIARNAKTVKNNGKYERANIVDSFGPEKWQL